MYIRMALTCTSQVCRDVHLNGSDMYIPANGCNRKDKERKRRNNIAEGLKKVFRRIGPIHRPPPGKKKTGAVPKVGKTTKHPCYNIL